MKHSSYRLETLTGAPMNPEIIVNLWCIMYPDSQLIWGLAGRAYYASGSDEEKTALLKQLAATDYAMASKLTVPDRFVVDESSGFCTLDELDNPATTLFEEVYQEIESELGFRYTVGTGETLKIPENPLYVVTCLLEDKNGNLIPVVG